MKFDIAEIMNLRHLERVLAREEEVKKRAVVHKAVYSGPQTRYLSRNGKHFFITCQYFSSCGFLSPKNVNILHWWRLIIFTFPVLVTLFVTCFGFDIKNFLPAYFKLIGIFIAGKSYLEFSKGLSFQSKISAASTPCKCILCANHWN